MAEQMMQKQTPILFPPPTHQMLYQLDQIFAVPNDLLLKFTHSKRVGNYLIGKTLGEGSFAKVKLGMHILTGMQVAIKIVCKETIKNDAYMRKHYRREAKLHQLFVHPNIVQLYEVLETDNSLYLVMELCTGGDVIRLLKQKDKGLGEKESRKILRQLLFATEYIHRHGVLHRDLKAENFLLTDESTLKITDFGLSAVFMKQVVTVEGKDVTASKDVTHQTQCGSPAYASPEVLSQRSYSRPADVWSLGVNLFHLLHGKLPFMVEPFSMKGLLQKVQNYEIEPIRADLSADCQDLLKRMLCLNDRERITISQAMQHPWIVKNSETGGNEPLETYCVTNSMVMQSINRTVLKYMCSRFKNSRTIDPLEVIQMISLNSPHQINATYHLLLSKFNKHCKAHSLPIDYLERRDGASNIPAPLSSPGSSKRYSTLQKVAVVTRPLRRPQVNKSLLLPRSEALSQETTCGLQCSCQHTVIAPVSVSNSKAQPDVAHARNPHCYVSQSKDSRTTNGANRGDVSNRQGVVEESVNGQKYNICANVTADLRRTSGGIVVAPSKPFVSCSTPNTPTLRCQEKKTSKIDNPGEKTTRFSSVAEVALRRDIVKSRPVALRRLLRQSVVNSSYKSPLYSSCAVRKVPGENLKK